MQVSTKIQFIAAGILLISAGCAQQTEEINYPEPRISPSTHYFAGQILERQKDLLGAIHQYQMAVEADPAMARAYNRLAILHEKLGRPNEAHKLLKDGIEKNPESAILRNNFGYFSLRRGDFVAAEEQFQAALGLAPNFHQARMNLAIALARTKRFDESVREFGQVVVPEMAYYNVAVVCLDMESYIQAEWALRHAVEINPEFEEARDNLPLVTQLARAEIDRSINAGIDNAAATWACCSIDEPVQITLGEKPETARDEGQPVG